MDLQDGTGGITQAETLVKAIARPDPVLSPP